MAAVDLIQRRFQAIAARTGADGPVGRSQVVSLGAGFDTSFFRGRMEGGGGSPASSVYFEVDFPEVTARKASIFRKHPLLQRLVAGLAVPTSEAVPLEQQHSAPAPPSPDGRAAGAAHPDFGVVYTPTPTGGCNVSSQVYRMVTADLRDVAAVRSALLAGGFDPALPTLFLSECVLVYLEPEESCALIAWAASACPRSVFVTYEQIRPHDAFGQVMMRNLEERGYSLRGLNAFPDIAAQTARYRELGYQAATVADMNDVYYRVLPRGDVNRAERLELFDEVEEWHLMSAHYCIAVAVNELPAGAVPQSAALGGREGGAAPPRHGSGSGSSAARQQQQQHHHHHHATHHQQGGGGGGGGGSDTDRSEDMGGVPPVSPARVIITDMPAPPPKVPRSMSSSSGSGPTSAAGTVGAAPQPPCSTATSTSTTAPSATAPSSLSLAAPPAHASLSPHQLAVAVVAAHESEEALRGGSGSQGHSGSGLQRTLSLRSSDGGGSASRAAASGALSSLSPTSSSGASTGVGPRGSTAGGGGGAFVRNRSHSRSRSVAGSESEMEIALAVEAASGTTVEGMDLTPSPSPRLQAGVGAGDAATSNGLPHHPPHAAAAASSSQQQPHHRMGSPSPSPSTPRGGGGVPSVIYTHGGDVHNRASHPLDFGAIAEAEEELSAARHLRGAMMPQAAVVLPPQAAAAAAAAPGGHAAASAGGGSAGRTGGVAAMAKLPVGAAVATATAAVTAAAAAATHYDAATIAEATRPVSLLDMLLPIEQWADVRAQHGVSPSRHLHQQQQPSRVSSFFREE